MLSDGNGLLDEVVKVLRDGGVQTVGLEDPQNLVTGDESDLGDTVAVSEDDTDLGRGETSSSELEDLVTDVLRGGLGPRGLRSSVRKRRRRDTLSGSVHSKSR